MRGTAKNDGGRHLAHIVGHRLDALGEVGDGAGAQRQEGREGALGDVAERQEGELLAVAAASGTKASAFMIWKITLRCASIEPLGGPVVPEV